MGRTMAASNFTLGEPEGPVKVTQILKHVNYDLCDCHLLIAIIYGKSKL